MRILLIIFITLVSSAFAEEVGPRKPWQMIGSVLNISQEQKVILFNKGHEDGVAEGDHAWFWSHNKKGFKAECLRVSESRSVWQLYRLENEEILAPNVALLARQATKPLFVPSPEDSDRL